VFCQNNLHHSRSFNRTTNTSRQRLIHISPFLLPPDTFTPTNFPKTNSSTLTTFRSSNFSRYLSYIQSSPSSFVPTARCLTIHSLPSCTWSFSPQRSLRECSTTQHNQSQTTMVRGSCLLWEFHSTLTQPIGVTTSGKLSIVDVAARESGKTYAMWNGKAVEVGHTSARFSRILTCRAKQITDDLLSIFICPSDMNGVPCEHDEIHGCRKIRLCKVSHCSKNRPAYPN
jgi:hypothetical protein